MPAPLEFYFDFSSPYGYIAANRIDAIAAKHGRGVTWLPFLLGVAFRSSGGQPLVDYPMKGDYSRADFARSAREHAIPFNMPARFPLATQMAARSFYWLDAGNADLARRFAKAAYAAYFADGRDITDASVLSALASSLGIDAGAMLTAAAAETWKAKLRDMTDEAVGRGVFGSPFVFVDGEPFWGADRLDMVDRWLARGGW
ncbi:2-hydroxychromene-2-carboxylate isomerase [Desertibaculum subflavum]|uniref:2-hydroxychromene-2-carboxylate isomerase n=1 Tax=Desertibaculum subflavum TaxID=2268458 RepID=UPI000E67283B